MIRILANICIIVYFLIVTSESNAVYYQKQSNVSEVLFIQNDGTTEPNRLYNDILKLGYSIELILPDSVTEVKLQQHDLVVLSTGSNPIACQSGVMRLALQNFIIEDFGKVIVEGGHTGFISAVFPYYPGFQNKVIKIDNWVADNGGNLAIAANHILSQLATEPNILPAIININYSNIYNMDVCTNNKFSELFYKTTLFNDKVGILVAPTINNPQIINYFFDYSSIADRIEANKLLQNSIFNLIGKPVAIYNNGTIIPSSAILYQNYPNPFNPVTNFEFEIPKIGFYSLKIFDLLGNELTTLVNGKLSPGIYKYNYDASVLSSGVYFYRLQTENFIESKKMTLIK